MTEDLKKEMDGYVQKLRDLHIVLQRDRDLSDYYLQGFYNGVELALSIMEDRQPVFKWSEK